MQRWMFELGWVAAVMITLIVGGFCIYERPAAAQTIEDVGYPPPRPENLFLELLVRHWENEGEIADTIAVNPADVAGVVERVFDVKLPPETGTFNIPLRFQADESVPRGTWRLDRFGWTYPNQPGGARP